MPLWKNTDDAANSTIFAAAQLKQAPNTDNRDALFGNTTANAYFDGVTVGQYGVDDKEIAANPGVAHTGWVLRTEGQGGRAGRVMTEVLVAGGITGDAEDTSFPDYIVRITSEPVANTGSISGNITRTFGVGAATTPTGGTLSYLWYYSTTSATAGFATTAAVSGFSGQTTNALSANIATLAANVWVRAVVSVSGGNASVNTATVKFTATA